MTAQTVGHLGPPPARTPTPASEARSLTGRRVILDSVEGYVHDVRAVSEVRHDLDGDFVMVATEADWYDWSAPAYPIGQWPRGSKAWPVQLVYVDF